MEWLKVLYNATKNLWEKNGRMPDGYSIFYSPVTTNPEVLIIGYNPGGDQRSFKDVPEGPPAEHDYIRGDYPMAKKMRHLFNSGGLLPLLENSVKMNLFFFRSKNAASVKGLDDEIKNFCLSETKQIIDRLTPKTILAEGFETFSELLELLHTKQTREVPFKDRTVMLVSDYNGTKLLGIPHPTGARGLTNDHWEEIGRLIRVEMGG